MRINLRTKALLICSFLLLLPWLGYRYIAEMETVLRSGQERYLLGTAQALATALHERPQLFNTSASFQAQIEKGKDLYAYELNQPIVLDGDLSDWRVYRSHFQRYTRRHVQYSRYPYKQEDFAFEHMLGRYGEQLYAVFDVTDPTLVTRRSNSLRIDRNDHLIIAMTSPEGEFKRFAIPAQNSGWVSAFEFQDDISIISQLTPAPYIQGYWKNTDSGYQLEIRFPAEMVGNKLGFAWNNVTSSFNRDIETVIATSSVNNAGKLGSLVVPSPEIDRILKGMTHNSVSLKVVDRHRRVLAKSGSLNNPSGLWEDSIIAANQLSLIDRLLQPIFQLLLPPIENEIASIGDDAQLTGLHVTQALEGRSYIRWQRSNANVAPILSAAHPVWVDGEVMGAVIAEETGQGIQQLTTQALRKLFSLSSAVVLLGLATLLLFASRISNRVRRLRDNTEQAIDTHGRLKNKIELDTTKDEIGDLSQGLNIMLERLDGYHQYLENMSSKLAHELRTPVAVVRSSLENLAFFDTEPANQAYIQRAQEGISRLNTILTQMTEATRIEQSLENMEAEYFILNDLIEGCTHGYSLAYQNVNFDGQITSSPLRVKGCADHIAQCLDKIVANACDFHTVGTPITINLSQTGQFACISINNQGPNLPEEMKDQLFNSMISVRNTPNRDKPHLGLGLYIAKLIVQYHNGYIHLTDNQSSQGVTATISIPLDDH
ncbi:proteobacterial dedicated sortase system histidine kinase [Thaumasiovibrio sp. DFM-14]|uniref:proteobacterial dedicated sortase system histidine kinase n=1 Tax=Thaumasiovibrio sp. DFM-14 TaxID=3384792 RepID=UPI0039A1F763